MRYGSVCSGIEAASVAWKQLGWEAAWFSEIDAFPSKLLSYRYPSIKNLGDMTTIAERLISGEVEAPEILVGGTPCQAFSVAGMRNGLDDPRGILTIKFVEIADAIDRVRGDEGLAESIVVWENVPGVLSSKDNAFGCFLGALAGEDRELQPPGRKWTDAGCVYGPKRAVAWRVLDAQYFGLAQRRKRVFVVASAREGFCPTEVLFESKGLRRDTPPSKSEEEGFTRAATTSLAFGGGNTKGSIDPATCLTAKGVRQDFDAETFIVQSQHYHLCGNASYIEYDVIRRLTPVECERLQGFPDGYTMIPWKNKPIEQCPDSHRYKSLGNSMAVPVMQWIGNRIDRIK